MQNNPYDDFMKNLAKMIEEIMNNLPQQDNNPRFIGCTIIAGNPGDLSNLFQNQGDNAREIQYEVIEADDRFFITAIVPADLKSAPYADIKPDFVRIYMDDMETKIDLPTPGDVIHSFYMVRHGVMDVMIKKAQKQQII
ncbi:MAG: hypothetical protein LUQ45_02550 [Methanoregulaceae archaeon]|nr:hypothetical protein [Methanoregulaceae archaeon]